MRSGPLSQAISEAAMITSLSEAVVLSALHGDRLKPVPAPRRNPGRREKSPPANVTEGEK
jgi:hypothetical protein